MRVRSMAAFMATQTEHSPNQPRRAPRRHPAQPVTMRAESGGSTPTRGSDLAYGTPRPPQASAGASGGGRGALVPGLCIFHRTLQDRATGQGERWEFNSPFQETQAVGLKKLRAIAIALPNHQTQRMHARSGRRSIYLLYQRSALARLRTGVCALRDPPPPIKPPPPSSWSRPRSI